MSDRTFRQLLQVATQISDRAADASGFVPLRSLAREVQAEVRFRPLLVEGIAAQPKTKDGRWLILIDSETHGVSDEMFAKEDALHPLGPRVRNTVAHELAHALGPRCEALTDGTEKSRKELVAIIERETEQLSPVLLVPQKSIESLLNTMVDAFDVNELVAARERLGVSSRVFVKRVELLSHDIESSVRHHPRLANIVIGSGEWVNGSNAELHPMPFRGVSGLLPEFVALLRGHKKVVIDDHFPAAEFFLNGGSDATSRASVWFGTTAQPRSEQGVVEITVERTPRKAAVSFLWTARCCGSGQVAQKELPKSAPKNS